MVARPTYSLHITLLKYFFLGLFSFISLGGLNAQIRVNVTPDTTNMMIGDQIELVVKVRGTFQGKNLNADLSDLGNFEIISQPSRWDTLQEGGKDVLVQKIIVTCFEEGSQSIPPVKINTGNNQNSAITSPPILPVMVHEMRIDSTKGIVRDIKPIMAEGKSWGDILWLAFWILIWPILAFLGYKGFQKWMERQTIVETPPPPKPLAHKTAFEALSKLEEEKLWQKGNIKAYQTELTRIVRAYIEDRYEVSALESTTDEILEKLKPLGFEQGLEAKIKEMLQLADMVKFAKANPPLETHDRLLKYAYDFIHATKQNPLQENQE